MRIFFDCFEFGIHLKLELLQEENHYKIYLLTLRLLRESEVSVGRRPGHYQLLINHLKNGSKYNKK